MYSLDKILKFDPEVAKAIEDEVNRQRNNIELIASENFVSEAVMQAMGTPLTNKYAEGYPGKGIMAVVNVLMLLRILPLNVRRRFSEQNMQMFSPIQEHRQTWQYFLQS